MRDTLRLYLSHALAGLAVGFACYFPYLWLAGGALNQADSDDLNVSLLNHSIPAGRVASWGFLLVPLALVVALLVAKLRPLKQLNSWRTATGLFITALLFGAFAFQLALRFLVFRGWDINLP